MDTHDGTNQCLELRGLVCGWVQDGGDVLPRCCNQPSIKNFRRGHLYFNQFGINLDIEQCAQLRLASHCFLGGWKDIGGGRERRSDLFLNQFRSNVDYEQCANWCLELLCFLGGWKQTYWSGGGFELRVWHFHFANDSNPTAKHCVFEQQSCSFLDYPFDKFRVAAKFGFDHGKLDGCDKHAHARSCQLAG